MIESTVVYFVIIIFVAALIRSTFGFGDALIAMPLLALFFDLKIASPIVAFCGFFISVIILSKHWKKVDFSAIKYLIIFSIIGIPIGIIFLKDSHEVLVKTLLALTLIIFSIFKLLEIKGIALKTNKTSPIFGIISGILGGAYNTNGPPIIIYGSLRGWTPDEFRVVLQGVFLPTNLFIIMGHGIAGLWTETVFHYTLISLVAIIIAFFIGRKLNKIIPAEKFTKFVYIFLLLIGAMLLFNIYF
jgi:uncharacterized membrane protein YfcA